MPFFLCYTIIGCYEAYGSPQPGDLVENGSVRMVSNLTQNEPSPTTTLNVPSFLNYTNSIYGFKIKHPSNWIVSPPEETGRNFTINDTSKSGLELAVTFSSPTSENLTVSVDRSVQTDSDQPVLVRQYIDSVLNETRRAFEEFDLHDLRINSEPISNDSTSPPNFDLNARVSPVIFNITYAAEKAEGGGLSPLRGMDVGAIINNTAFIISYQSASEGYPIYLPVVLDMIYSFEITNLDRHTRSPSSSAVTVSPQSESSSNASAISTEQNTLLGQETGNSSPGTQGSVTPPPPLTTQQMGPNYAPESAYPTTQFYPPGYSPYPMGYSPYADYSPYAGYSPYADYSPYANYLPYIGIDPIIPITPVIPPGEYTNPTILSYNTYNDTSGVFHIVGEVENSSPYRINSVQVIAAFYDNLNQLLAIEFAYTNPPSIPPGQIAFFDLTIPAGTIPVDRVSQWTLRLVWQ